VTGAVPHTFSAAGTLHVDLGLVGPGCLPATVLCAGIQSMVAADFLSGGLVSPWRFPSSIARGHPTRCRHEAAVLAGGYSQGPASWDLDSRFRL